MQMLNPDKTEKSELPQHAGRVVYVPQTMQSFLIQILKQSHGEGIMDSGRELGTGYAHCGTTGVEGPVVGGVLL